VECIWVEVSVTLEETLGTELTKDEVETLFPGAAAKYPGLNLGFVHTYKFLLKDDGLLIGLELSMPGFRYRVWRVAPRSSWSEFIHKDR
jgi:hypothetical protein